MLYAIFGKLFITSLIFVMVWVVIVLLAGTKDWGDSMAAAFFIGPILGLIIALLVWFLVLPALP